MTSIGKLVGHSPDPRTFERSPKIVDNRTFIGIEIELEGADYFSNEFFKNSRFWSQTNEGSLRNGGREFITGVSIQGYHVPICGKDVVDALEHFDKAIKEHFKAKNHHPEVTERTSVHIHIDIRELTREQLLNYLLLYVIFESVFFSVFGKGRENNPYCKPISTTQECQERISELLNIERDDIARNIFCKGDKYDACNLKAINDQGSLEFRLHEGSIDSKKILYWLNLLLILKNKACEEGFDIKTLPQKASEVGIVKFLEFIFGEFAKDIHIDDVERNILQGVRVAQDILISFDLNKSNNTYKRARKGMKAKEDSILHQWARENNREIFIDADEAGENVCAD